jgi:hypothetical protein
MAVFELVHREHLGRHRDVLFLAAGIGKAKVDELDLFLFDHFQHVGWGSHCDLLVEAGKSRGSGAKERRSCKSQNYAITKKTGCGLRHGVTIDRAGPTVVLCTD